MLDCVFTRDGARLLLHRADGIQVYDGQTFALLGSLEKAGVRTMAVSADGRQLALAIVAEARPEAAGTGDDVFLYDVLTLAEVARLETPRAERDVWLPTVKKGDRGEVRSLAETLAEIARLPMAKAI